LLSEAVVAKTASRDQKIGFKNISAKHPDLAYLCQNLSEKTLTCNQGEILMSVSFNQLYRFF
jgi:hypothetical protein